MTLREFSTTFIVVGFLMAAYSLSIFLRFRKKIRLREIGPELPIMLGILIVVLAMAVYIQFK